MRLPKHIGIIPDGNRRWALNNNLSKADGYQHGIAPGLELFKLCQKEGIEEVTFYGYTVDNIKRPTDQKEAFKKACIESVMLLTKEDCEILVVGDTSRHTFPPVLLPFTGERKVFGKGGIKVNFLIHYGWSWDLNLRNEYCPLGKFRDPSDLGYRSKEISRIDLIIRWGGRRRLSGFLPIQSVYADFYILENMWPDFKEQDFYDALKWYSKQDVTLGG